MTGSQEELQSVPYQLADQGTHQAPIVTSRRDLPAIEVAYPMFEVAPGELLQVPA